MRRDQRANEGGEVMFFHCLLNISSQISAGLLGNTYVGDGDKISRGWIPNISGIEVDI